MNKPLDHELPSWRKLLGEGPAMARLMVRQFRTPPFAGEPFEAAPVMVLPGFMTSDLHTGLLRRTIGSIGGRAYGWGEGINRGADTKKFAKLLQRLDRLAGETGNKLVLLGWSLGGLYARELAKRRPDTISMVVTLGSPFSHGPGRNNARKFYELVNDHSADDPPIAHRPEDKPPVFTVACWSRKDGMVAPISAAGEDDESDVQVELHCTHHDMVSDPEALRIIVAILRAERALHSAIAAPRPENTSAQPPIGGSGQLTTAGNAAGAARPLVIA
jgi:pimeloyl-ACP methyl ester carboxylesterase